MVGVFILVALLLVFDAVWLIRMIATWRCIKTMQEKPHVRVKYYCTKYPPYIGYMPYIGMVESEDYCERRYIAEIDRMAYGHVVYNRELRCSEIRDYGLIHEPVE